MTVKGECYEFEVETHVTHNEEVRVTTSRAEVILIPDSSASNQLRLAKVVLKEGVTSGEKAANDELVRVLVGYGYPSTKLVDPLSSPLMIKGHKESDTGGRTQILTKTSDARIVKRYDPRSPKALRIDVNSDSPAIAAYFDAMMKQDPFDRCLGLLKVLEFLCVGKRRSTEDALRHGLGKSWWIPQETEKRLMDLMAKRLSLSKDASAYLWHLRNRISHLKRGGMQRIRFGMRPRSRENTDEVFEALEVLREIVRYSLEQHPGTRERST
jgi:hypothetical protein